MDADHDKVATTVANYVLQFMSEHERKYVKSELTSFEEYPLSQMKSCVVRLIFSIMEKDNEPAECKCHEQKPARVENNREAPSARRKSKPSITDSLQICFIHG